jgi:tetratricopeptide (TPR) repeat protein
MNSGLAAQGRALRQNIQEIIMTNHQRQDSLTQNRIEARRLLRQLQSPDPEEAAIAADRFRQLRSLSSVPGSQVSYLVERVRLKHALAVIAQERGYESWKALKTAHERADNVQPETVARELQPNEVVELVVLSVRERAGRCRLQGGDAIVTLRASHLWDVVPGEIAIVRPRKQWRYNGHSYLSGEIESARLDGNALGLVPLQLHDEGIWDPEDHYWGEEGEPIEEWAEPIIAKGPRPEFKIENVIRGADPDDPFSDPIIEAADLKEVGNYKEAHRILMDLCEADLRCIDAHAHLGNLVFDLLPKDAIRHYAVGLQIGELSLGDGFDGLLPWGYIDNRPYLRCMHNYGLCLWRMGRFDEAERVFRRMLWLNPSDNQGARFLLNEVRAGFGWADCYGKKTS